MLRFYTHPLSTYARRVAMAFLEKGIPHEDVVIDLAQPRAKRPADYVRLNPYNRVPTLVDGDLVLYESSAILAYLEAIHPTPPLVPPDAKGRALVDMHIKLCDLQMTRQTGIIIFPKRFIPKDKWRHSDMAQAKAEIEAHLEILESHLAGRRYLVGERYSLADLAYTPFIDFFPLMEISPPPAVARWTAELLARPSAAATKPPH